MQKVWYSVGIISIAIIVFTAGFFVGRRERIDEQDDIVTVISSNNAIENSLTRIETRDFWGSPNARDRVRYGQFYFKVIDGGKTEILMRLESIPDKIIGVDNQAPLNIPSDYKILFAVRSTDKLDYDFIEVGTITLVNDGVNIKSGSFSTILDRQIFGVERVWLVPVDPSITNVYSDTSSDLPPKTRTMPAPFFWVII